MNCQNAKKASPAYIISLGTITILGVFSIVAYKERMLFLDPAFIAFNIINEGHLAIQGHRYGSFITQVFPLIGSYLGLSVQAILILYSLSFYLFYLATAVIVGSIFQQRWLAILLALYLLLFVSDGYFWPNNEVHQGIAWMLLFLGYYQFSVKEKKRPKIITYLTLAVLAALAISSHLLVLLPFAFLWAYVHLSQDWKLMLRNKPFLILSAILLILVMVRYQLSTAFYYDEAKLENINKINLSSIRAAFLSGHSRSFSALIATNYWASILVFFGSIIILIRNSQYFLLLLMVAFATIYYCLICITYPEAFDRTLQFYIESEWMAISIIIATPLALTLANAKPTNILSYALGLLIVVRLGYIFASFSFFHDRYLKLEQLVSSSRSHGVSKSILRSSEVGLNIKFIMSWGIPVESILLSKMQGSSPQITIKPTGVPLNPLPTRRHFYSAFKILDTDSLNAAYFQLDTLRPYQIYYWNH